MNSPSQAGRNTPSSFAMTTRELKVSTGGFDVGRMIRRSALSSASIKDALSALTALLARRECLPILLLALDLLLACHHLLTLRPLLALRFRLLAARDLLFALCTGLLLARHHLLTLRPLLALLVCLLTAGFMLLAIDLPLALGPRFTRTLAIDLLLAAFGPLPFRLLSALDICLAALGANPLLPGNALLANLSLLARFALQLGGLAIAV